MVENKSSGSKSRWQFGNKDAGGNLLEICHFTLYRQQIQLNTKIRSMQQEFNAIIFTIQVKLRNWSL